MGIFISRENLDRLGVAPAQDTKILTLQSTEYSWTVPDGCKRVVFGLRSGSYSLKYGWATAELNFTVPAGAFRDVSDIYLVSQTLWFKCDDAAGEVVEIEYFL